jgi:preprotein translocase subunit SecB
MTEQEAQTPEKHLSVVKIYVKDFSFESPQVPTVFNTKEWGPSTNLNLRSSHTPVSDSLHEVVLTITVDAKEKESEKTIFLVELQQAGLFEISGYEKEEMGVLIGSFCPGVLYPYAREAIAGIIQKGGFPEFVLQPINFDALNCGPRRGLLGYRACAAVCEVRAADQAVGTGPGPARKDSSGASEFALSAGRSVSGKYRGIRRTR